MQRIHSGVSQLVIDGVGATTPSAQWPLLAQMVCDLTNRGQWKSGGQLQGSRPVWVVLVSRVSMYYEGMLLLWVFLHINVSGNKTVFWHNFCVNVGCQSMTSNTLSKNGPHLVMLLPKAPRDAAKHERRKMDGLKVVVTCPMLDHWKGTRICSYTHGAPAFFVIEQQIFSNKLIY